MSREEGGTKPREMGFGAFDLLLSGLRLAVDLDDGPTGGLAGVVVVDAAFVAIFGFKAESEAGLVIFEREEATFFSEVVLGFNGGFTANGEPVFAGGAFFVGDFNFFYSFRRLRCRWSLIGD